MAGLTGLWRVEIGRRYWRVCPVYVLFFRQHVVGTPTALADFVQ